MTFVKQSRRGPGMRASCLAPQPLVRRQARRPHPNAGFTLIELLTVMLILSIIAALTLPAVKSLTKSNDQSQATNLVRSVIASARSIAVSQHRMAGVVFFEETPTYSRPANANQTAMQIFVEDYNQAQYMPAAGVVYFIYYSTARQYLPGGVKLATLSDVETNGGISLAENGDNTQTTRAILFDANGELTMRGGLAAPALLVAPNNVPGTYPQAFADWKFGNAPSVTNAYSSPGFFLYSKTDYDAKGFGATGNDAARAAWLKQNADVIIVNANTGNIIR